MTSSTNETVNWEELLPDTFKKRQSECPIVYLPMGLCEPHGHIAALGLDTLKAVYLCREAAKRFGGIVAPTQGYQIHETGFHAPWLAEVVGNEKAFLTSMPPSLIAQNLLYQLRSFVNAGFKAAMIITGHSGGNQCDLRTVASAFTEATDFPVHLASDPEFVEGKHSGDHAGVYEISQLMYIRTELVDLSLINRQHEPNSGGRLALYSSAAQATPEYGKQIMEDILAAIELKQKELLAQCSKTSEHPRISMQTTEDIWQKLSPTVHSWTSNNHYPVQPQLTPDSIWYQP